VIQGEQVMIIREFNLPRVIILLAVQKRNRFIDFLQIFGKINIAWRDEQRSSNIAGTFICKKLWAGTLLEHLWPVYFKT
jgi:hypothetical protein